MSFSLPAWALKQALRWGLVPRNASESVDLPRLGNEEVEVLLPEEVRSFLDATETAWRRFTSSRSPSA